MVKPGGTGRPRLAISARLAPLPPSRSFMPERPCALPPPKMYTHWPFAPVPAEAFALLFAEALRFGTGLLFLPDDGFAIQNSRCRNQGSSDPFPAFPQSAFLIVLLCQDRKARHKTRLALDLGKV